MKRTTSTTRIEKAVAALDDTAHSQVKTRIGTRYVVVNALTQKGSGEWLMAYSHRDFTSRHYATCEPGQKFTIRHF